MKEIKQLTFDENKKYRVAISRGYFENFSREWKHTFAGAFIWKHPGRVKAIDTFRDMLGHIPTWNDITDTNLKDWRDELTKYLAPNSCRTIFAEIKAVINDNLDEHEIPSSRFDKILVGKRQPTQAVYLNSEEISRIIRYVPRSRTERYVQKIFCIESLTGARVEDARKLSLENCNNETGDMSYVAAKTHTLITLPMHTSVYQFLADPIQLDTDIDTFNETIRRICMRCGIDDNVSIFRRGKDTTAPKWKFVSSHTGRKSFATNLFLNQVDPYLIARFMGHSSPEITITRYICGYRRVDENAMKYFQTAI